MSPTLSGSTTDNFNDRQFIVITSEKQARVVALPSQNCVYRQQIADTDYVVKTEIISLKGLVFSSSLLHQVNKINLKQNFQIVFVSSVIYQQDIF